MSRYLYTCEPCGHTTEVLRTVAGKVKMADVPKPAESVPCEKCGCAADRDFKAELGRESGEYQPWLTTSLGTAPAENPAEFERKYAQFGVKVLNHETGLVSVPHDQQEKYCAARGRTRDIDRRRNWTRAY